MPNMEELLNQNSVEITRDRTKELMISKIYLGYEYGQMELSKETSRQFVFAITGGKFSGYYRLKKGFYARLADIPTIVQGIENIFENRPNFETFYTGIHPR